MVEYAELLETHKDGRQMCSICGKSIPKDIKRISLSYCGMYGGSNKRICARCILYLAELIDKEKVAKWENKLVLKSL